MHSLTHSLTRSLNYFPKKLPSRLDVRFFSHNRSIVLRVQSAVVCSW